MKKRDERRNMRGALPNVRKEFNVEGEKKGKRSIGRESEIGQVSRLEAFVANIKPEDGERAGIGFPKGVRLALCSQPPRN